MQFAALTHWASGVFFISRDGKQHACDSKARLKTIDNDHCEFSGNVRGGRSRAGLYRQISYIMPGLLLVMVSKCCKDPLNLSRSGFSLEPQHSGVDT